MSDQTVTQFLHVSECRGKPSYFLYHRELKEDEEYKYLGQIEVPAVSEEALREMALYGVNSEIAKARLVLDGLEIKKQTLLAIDHKSGE